MWRGWCPLIIFFTFLVDLYESDFLCYSLLLRYIMLRYFYVLLLRNNGRFELLQNAQIVSVPASIPQKLALAASRWPWLHFTWLHYVTVTHTTVVMIHWNTLTMPKSYWVGSWVRWHFACQFTGGPLLFHNIYIVIFRCFGKYHITQVVHQRILWWALSVLVVSLSNWSLFY